MPSKTKARDYTQNTLKKLFLLSGNRCFQPLCQKQFLAFDQTTVVSKVCHIEAASSDGPRYNPAMDDDQRRHFDNLLLLCDECHSVIDNKVNEQQYPVELLKAWKAKHEASATYQHLIENPSLLGKVIDAIAELDLDIVEMTSDSHSYEIEEKLEYNNVRHFRALINEHKMLFSKINAVYRTLEEQGSFKKDNLLRNIRTTYLRVVGKYRIQNEEPIECIRTNADRIIEEVEDSLRGSVTPHSKCTVEDLAYGLSVVVVDAFIRCKILERPPVDDLGQ